MEKIQSYILADLSKVSEITENKCLIYYFWQ